MAKTEPYWTAIEVPYRAGILSVRQIVKSFGVTLSRLQKHAKKNRWTRDLAPRVRQATRERLAENNLEARPSDLNAPSDLDTDLAQSQGMSGPRDEERRVNSHVADEPCARARAEAEIVEAVSRLQADVIRAHKRDILKAQRLVTRMLQEIEAFNVAEIVKTLGQVYCERTDGRRLAEALRAVSTPTRATTIRTLASAMETLVKIERQAYAMDADKAGDDAAVPLEERLKAYALAAREAAIDGSGGRVVEFAGGKRPFPADKPL